MVKILSINLYDYNELSKNAKAETYKNWRENEEVKGNYFWSNYVEKSFTAFAEFIGCEINTFEAYSLEYLAMSINPEKFMTYSRKEVLELALSAFRIGYEWGITGSFTDAIFTTFAEKVLTGELPKNATPEDMKQALESVVQEYQEYIKEDMEYMLSEEEFLESGDAYKVNYLKDGRVISEDLLNLINE